MASTNILMSLSATWFPPKCLVDDVCNLILILIRFSLSVYWRLCGQIEHLEEGPIKSDQVFIYEGISGSDVIVHRKLEQGTNGIIGVEGQTLAVGDQDKEKGQKELFLIEGRKKAIREKAVRDKAEAALNASNPIGVEDLLLDHG